MSSLGAQILYPTGLVGLFEQGSNGKVSDPFASPKMPDSILLSKGTGTHSLPLGTFSGKQGSIEVWVRAPATGADRSVVILGDAAVPSTFIEIFLDSANRVSVTHKNLIGTDVGVSTSEFSSMVAGTLRRIRYAWSCETPIDGARYAKLRSFEDVGSAGWTTDPISSWTSFIPTHLFVGVGGIGTGGDFTGVVEKVELSNQVVLI